MTKDPSDQADTSDARSLLENSEEALRDALTALNTLSRRVRDGEDIPPAEFTRTLTSLSQARTRLTEEVTRYEDRMLRARQRVADAALDFDAIRSEIGGKIDRIRASLDPD